MPKMPDVDISAMVDIPTLLRTRSFRQATTLEAAGGTPDTKDRRDPKKASPYPPPQKPVRVDDTIKTKPFPGG
jgi:hypothetical protein